MLEVKSNVNLMKYSALKWSTNFLIDTVPLYVPESPNPNSLVFRIRLTSNQFFWVAKIPLKQTLLVSFLGF